MLPSATPSLLALLLAAGLVGLAGCGDSTGASDGLSAGEGCDAAAEMCAEGCAATCVDGAWQCDCNDATTTTTAASTGPTTGGSGDTASASGDASATGDDSATTDASTSVTSTSGGDSTTTDATTGDATDGVTTGDDSTTGTTTGTTGEMTGSTTMDAWEPEQHVHIYIDNFCKVTVDPPEITVPVDETVTLSYHNHSVDYLADVWMSYGGGFLELELGATWDDQFEWCTGPNPSTGWADISIAGGGNNACPKHRMYIHCE